MNAPAPKVDPKGESATGPTPISVGEGPQVEEPGGEAPGKGVGSLEYRLGVVGERSSGDEATTRVGVERGEVRIPE